MLWLHLTSDSEGFLWSVMEINCQVYLLSLSPLLALLFVCAGINSSTVYIPCIVTKGLGIAILSHCLLPKRSFKC